jgi:hypothetical protein
MAAPDMVAFVKSLDLPPHSLSVPLRTVGAGGGAGQQSRSSDPEEPLVDMAAPDMVAFVKSLDLPPHSLSVPLSPQS